MQLALGLLRPIGQNPGICRRPRLNAEAPHLRGTACLGRGPVYFSVMKSARLRGVRFVANSYGNQRERGGLKFCEFWWRACGTVMRSMPPSEEEMLQGPSRVLALHPRGQGMRVSFTQVDTRSLT